MKKILLTVSFLFFFGIPGYGQSTLALQEKCAEGAKRLESEKLSQAYPAGVANPCVSFQNHYNSKLDKCLMRICYYFGQEKGQDGLKFPFYGVGLYNVFESSQAFGELTCLGSKVLKCYIGNKKCESSDEFEILIKPYMEE